MMQAAHCVAEPTSSRTSIQLATEVQKQVCISMHSICCKRGLSDVLRQKPILDNRLPQVRVQGREGYYLHS